MTSALLSVATFALTLGGCASRPAPSTASTGSAVPAAVPAAPAAVPAAVPAAPPAAPTAAIRQIGAGATPGSNTHRWGSRYFDLRSTPAGTEMRIHDVWSFQGSGMQPHQMPRSRHECTPWELVPADVVAAVPAGAPTCSEPRGACTSLTTWLANTAPAPTPAPARTGATQDDPPMLEPATSSSYGRGFGACGG